jgi:hypothetical protein
VIFDIVEYIIMEWTMPAMIKAGYAGYAGGYAGYAGGFFCAYPKKK